VGKRKGGQLAWQVGKRNQVDVTPLDEIRPDDSVVQRL
jgi:hypothetical protein